MSAKLISVESSVIKIELTIELSESMLENEIKIQEKLNEAGRIASKEALKQQDTDGSVLEIGEKKWRTKGEEPKAYQTPYGEVVVERHVYQKAGGGKTYCPMERNARIIVTSTPMFAKQISSKMSYGAGAEVQRDLLLMLRGRNGHFLKERETGANGVEVKFSLESKVIEFSLDEETLQLNN